MQRYPSPPLLAVLASPQKIVQTHLANILIQLQLEKGHLKTSSARWRVSSWERSLQNTNSSEEGTLSWACGNLSSADSYKVNNLQHKASAGPVHLRDCKYLKIGITCWVNMTLTPSYTLLARHQKIFYIWINQEFTVSVVPRQIKSLLSQTLTSLEKNLRLGRKNKQTNTHKNTHTH